MSHPTDTNDKGILTRHELDEHLATSKPAGDKQINGVFAGIVSGDSLRIAGDAWINGAIKTPLTLTFGILFPDGSAANPSITFANDPDTGFYRAADGTIGVTSEGSPTINMGSNFETSVPITTPGGNNLVLNPGGPSVDFTGHTLINVAGLSSNPNRYEIVAPATVTTVNATPTLLFNISTVTDAVYNITLDVTSANVSDGTSGATFVLRTKGKNNSGVVSVIAPHSHIQSQLDASLAGTSVIFAISGINITVMVTGLAATTINWFGAAQITRQLF